MLAILGKIFFPHEFPSGGPYFCSCAERIRNRECESCWGGVGDKDSWSPSAARWTLLGQNVSHVIHKSYPLENFLKKKEFPLYSFFFLVLHWSGLNSDSGFLTTERAWNGISQFLRTELFSFFLDFGHTFGIYQGSKISWLGNAGAS